MKFSLIKGCCILYILSIIHSCKKEYSCEGCIRSNKPPIAIAGNDTTIVLPVNAIILDGSASTDADGKIISYNWTSLSGPGVVTIDKPGLAKTPVKNLALGIYQFQLSIKDDGGLISKDTVQIEVIAASKTNHPPVANAGPDQIISLPTNSVIVNGNNSTDPDNDIASYSWKYVSGPASSTIVSANTAQTQIDNLLVGTYQFQLLVTDASGLSSKDTVKIIVNNAGTVVDTDADIIITLPLDSIYLGRFFSTVISATMISGPISTTLLPTGVKGIMLVRNLAVGTYTFRLEENDDGTITVDTIKVAVINDPLETNTITFKRLSWILHDEYGLGVNNLSLRIPPQPNFFIAQLTTRPLIVYLQPDVSSPWLALPSGPYVYDANFPGMWIMRNPVDASWVGKTSNVKIKFL